MLFSRQDNKRKEQTQNMLYLDITKAVYAILNSLILIFFKAIDLWNGLTPLVRLCVLPFSYTKMQIHEINKSETHS